MFAMIYILPHIRLLKMKEVKRQQNMEKKHKVRKSLINVRVVQKNLVFVIGLSPSPEVCFHACVGVCVSVRACVRVCVCVRQHSQVVRASVW